MKKRFVIGLLLFVGVVLLHLVFAGNFITLEQIQEHRIYLQQLVEHHYLYSVGMYLLLFVVAALLGIPITVLLTVAAGYFFGVFSGLVYANIGATVGAVISFVTFRYFLGSFVQNRYQDQLKAFNRDIDAYGHNYLLTMQILPFTPTLLINIFAGLTKIPLWTFVWTTSLGILPGSLLYTLSGRHLADIRSISDLWSIRSFVLLLLLALFAAAPLLLRRKRAK